MVCAGILNGRKSIMKTPASSSSVRIGFFIYNDVVVRCITILFIVNLLHMK